MSKYRRILQLLAVAILIMVVPIGPLVFGIPGTTDGACSDCECIVIQGYSSGNFSRGFAYKDNNNVWSISYSAVEDVSVGANGLTAPDQMGYCQKKPKGPVAEVIPEDLIWPVTPTDPQRICTGNPAPAKYEINFSTFNQIANACKFVREVCTPGMPIVIGM